MADKKKFYFAHDYGARNDPRLRRMISALGPAAGWAWWVIVEELYEQGGFLPLDMVKDIARDARVPAKMVRSIICDFELFTVENQEDFLKNSENFGKISENFQKIQIFFSKTVLKNLKIRENISKKNQQNVQKRWTLKNDNQQENSGLEKEEPIPPYYDRIYDGNTTVIRPEIPPYAIKENKIKENEIINKKRLSNESPKNKKTAVGSPDGLLSGNSVPDSASEADKDVFTQGDFQQEESASQDKNQNAYKIGDLTKENPELDKLPMNEKQIAQNAEKAPNTGKKECDRVMQLWNEAVKETDSALKSIVRLTDTRQKKILVRLREFKKLGDPFDVAKSIFTKACKSKFLQGDNQRGWTGSFDWVIENERHWVSIYEGKYDNKETVQPQRGGTNPVLNVNDLWSK
ncbi:MAG: DUF4373 domain-containing protein [Bacteroidales bacterium]|nr:DUF4373 domain-containing protein [Candidatus Egerieousia equi]